MEQPQAVKRAVMLLWTALGIGAFFTSLSFLFPSFINSSEIPFSWLLVLGLFFTYGLYALLVWKISTRKNWARITYTVLVGLGITLEIFLIALKGFLGEFVFSFPSVEVLSNFITTGLQLYALYLLWTKPGTLSFTP